MAQRESIGVAIIGTGFARRTQLPAFQACEGAKIVAIASAHRENAERVAHEFGAEYFTDDWRTVMTRPDVDLVSIVTPPVTHLEMTLAALNAGKAVLCEKPMAMNAGETQKMVERANEAGLLALVDHELRFLPGRRKMREMLLNREIGKIHHAKFLFRADSRLDASRPWDWWSDIDAGGGVLGAIGSHAIDSFRWLINTEITRVSGTLSTHVRQRVDKPSGETKTVTTDDEAIMTLRFTDGEMSNAATGAISMSVVESGRPEHRMEFFGSKGAVRLEGDRLSHSATSTSEWTPIELSKGALAAGMSDNEWSRGFTTLSREIVKALREGRSAVDGAATFEDGHRTQLVLDTVRRSHESGCWTSV